MTAQPWATHDLIEWHPDQWSSLPGFAEAATTGFRVFHQPARKTTPRVTRTLADLTEERDAWVVKRDALTYDMGPLDHGVLSGVRRKPNGADRKKGAAIDRDLYRFVDITKRIEYLEYRMTKEGGRDGEDEDAEARLENVREGRELAD